MPPPVGYVTLASTDPPITVEARLWQDRPNVDSGFGGWDEIERPRRSPLTTFKGSPGLHLTLPLVLDHWTDEASIEATIRDVERLGEATSSDGEPPQLRLSVTGGAIPYADRTWVVEGIDWGDAIMSAAGDRVRQAFTLSLLEYVTDVYLTERSAAARRRKKSAKSKKKRGAAKKRVVAKRSGRRKGASARSAIAGSSADFGQGESLLSIAARELGDANRWPEIAALNGLRDPRAVAPGQELRLP